MCWLACGALGLSTPAHRLFGAHLEEESAGKVLLKRLDHSNQQFIRCRKAALENAKKNFFSTRGRYQGMVVTNVFKLEHPHLLKRFQKTSSSLAEQGSKVKGLFCSLEPKCVPRVAAFGTLQERVVSPPNTTVGIRRGRA
jgi:hypothetical protein